jgi:cytochrome c-type biogenesis protein CcmH
MSANFWLFGALAVLFAVAALTFVLPPLLRRTPGGGDTDRAAANIAIYHDQLAELKADLDGGELDAAQYQEARREIEKRLSEDVPAAQSAPAAALGGSGRPLAWALAAILPVTALGLYLVLGNPAALEAGRHDSAKTDGMDMDGMIAALENKLKNNPDNLEGWLMLARSLSALERHREAARAWARATALQPDNARLLADYAEALALAQGGGLHGEPQTLIEKALALDEKNPKALELAGVAAWQREDWAHAAAYWRRLLKVLPADDAFAREISAALAEAESKSGSDKPK